MTTSITVTARFSSAHFYAQPAWDDARNRAEFGRCYTPRGHGHNYRLEAEFVDTSAPELAPQLQGFLDSIVDPFEHAHLNERPEFRDLVPTTENIALVLWRRIETASAPAPVLAMKLFEMDDIWVEVRR